MTFYVVLIVLCVLAIDIYVFKAIRTIFAKRNSAWYLYLVSSIFTYATLVTYYYFGRDAYYLSPKIFLMGTAMALVITKTTIGAFVVVSDLFKGFYFLKALIQKRRAKEKAKSKEYAKSRAKFILQVGGVFGAFFFGTLIYGMAVGAYRLTKRRSNVYIPNLPKELEGLKIVHISDLHLGSFPTTEPVQRAVQAINNENADLFFFTGDLVNDKANEILPYVDILSGIKAKYGKYSILGNHDYGSYVLWDSKDEKRNNLAQQIALQKKIGWEVLLNEHRIIEVENKEVAVLGVEYWGKSARWEKQHGDIDAALVGLQSAAVKILLTHDPSHWDEVISQDAKYDDIALSLAGHTHGFQFGVEIPNIKWSPSQYAYPRWAGLYKEKNQYLYVNRGLGFLGYPGRVGIPPEITIITLTGQSSISA
ncbi:MAG TPA: metallophosphoesterase [Chitinophagales bacterium]|nr:metallophosphoesterase [Chitinophagales bacterium]